MPSSRDPRIDAYIARSAPFARPILAHLRELVHTACPAVIETMKWSMPYFEYHGLLAGMAAFKEHCSFGFWHQDMAAVVGTGKDDEAMGSFGRIAGLADLPPDRTMLRYLRAAVKLNESGAPARPRPKPAPKSSLRTPPVLAAALRAHPVAAAAFENFSPSHRREYIEWIAEAKREETRARRVATAITWLAEGKSRNWKYER